MKAIIIDNDTLVTTALQFSLKNHCESVALIHKVPTIKQAFQFIQQDQSTLIFLGVNLIDATTFDFINYLRHPMLEVIYLIPPQHHLLGKIISSGANYLLRPFKTTTVVDLVNQFKAQLPETSALVDNAFVMKAVPLTPQDNRIAIPKINGYEFITVQQIIRCEADRDNTLIHLEEKHHIYATKGLKYLSQLLEPYGFVRVHQSHLVNLRKIDRYFKGEGGSIKMLDQSVVDVSRRRKHDFLDTLKSLNML